MLEQNTNEQRKHARFHTWLPATISPRAGGAGRRVLITDVSEGGAGLQLVVPTAEPMPVQRFLLEASYKGTSGELPCELVKQTPSHLHVRFLELSWIQAMFLRGFLDFVATDVFGGSRMSKADPASKETSDRSLVS